MQWFIAVIPATWEMEIGRITVRGQSRQKSEISAPISTNSWAQWHTSVIQATWGNKNRRMEVQASWA
jgi:hypothetical protein